MRYMMLGVLLAGVVTMAGAPFSQVSADSDFDATGQFTLSFKFGLPGEDPKEQEPTVGFRVGASNVPTYKADEQDNSTRNFLNTGFDRRNFDLTTFSGVAIEFGDDAQGFAAVESMFDSPAAGSGGAYDLGNRDSLDYLEGDEYRAGSSGQWNLSSGNSGSGSASAGYNWTLTPLNGN